MATRPWHLLSLCDGYGGTELAIRSVAPVRTVARVERDSYAAAVLVERMAQARLDQCPIWDDVATFDGGPWRGRVDIVAAGFPCPDFSSAGRRAGVDGVHWLWPECFQVIRDVGPSVVLLENVPGLVRLGGLTRVLSDLADVGFDAEWGLLSAASVGAPHERARWWLVAWRDGDGLGWFRSTEPRRGRLPKHDANRCRSTVGHTGSAGRRQVTRGAPSDERADGWQPHGGHITDGPVEDVARGVLHDGVSGHRPRQFQSQLRRRWTQASGEHVWPPGRDDRTGWQRWIAEGGPQPVLRRSADGPPLGLADALHLGGNGLVPQCAAHAWGQLLDRGGWLT